MTADLALALAFGIGLGLGLWSLLSRVPAFARPRLAARIAPYLLDVSPEARRLRDRVPADPVPVIGVLAAPLLEGFQRAFGAVLGAPGRTTLRLRRAGLDRSVEGQRLRQLGWTATGAIVAGGVALLAGLAGSASQVAVVAGPIVGAGIGLAASDHALTRAARRRAARIESELPTVLEFLALSLAAGEGVHDALARVARVGSGVLADELGAVVAQTTVGVPLGAALGRLGDELAIPSLTRCLAHVVAALERGSPLADLLRVQAADAREEARRAMLESAGKKEVAMLVPLVFLILPVTVAFAVWPGIVVLQTRL
ncbi:MAG TPA: type II secretion system F family protein [Amnibacterium sp.]|jgi:tight adherence protein C|nr:type II secretion system F family protein [Amnibacterium sp.]